MIQRCPNCGAWCEASQDGMIDRALGGWADTIINDGEKGKSIAGSVGEFFGSAIGTYRGIINGAANAAFGDKYSFVCTNCGQEWSTDDDLEDETEIYQYEQAQKNKVSELSRQVNDYDEKSESEQQRYIQELRSTLEEVSGNSELTAVLYDTLSFAHFLFYEDYARAQDYINKSLSLYDDPRSRVMRGVFRGEGRGALDYYNKLTDLQCFEPEASLYLNDEYICGERNKTLSLCRDHFLEIPYSDRKFLMVVPTLDDIPQGSMEGRAVKVLPQAYVPSELQILGGVLQQNVVYVCHPYLQNCYIQYENFEQELLKDQINELQIFLGCLGAKSIQIIDSASSSSEENSEKNMSGKIGGKYKGMGGSVSGEMERKNSGSLSMANTLNICSQFEQQPNWHVEKASGWFKGNKDWQDMARLRQIGHTHYNLTVSSSSSRYVSDSDLKQLSADFDVLVCSGEANAKKTSSHEFKRSEEHSWILEVEFYPLSSYNNKEEASAMALPSSSAKKGWNKVYIAFISAIIILLGLIAWLLVR